MSLDSAWVVCQVLHSAKSIADRIGSNRRELIHQTSAMVDRTTARWSGSPTPLPNTRFRYVLSVGQLSAPKPPAYRAHLRERRHRARQQRRARRPLALHHRVRGRLAQRLHLVGGLLARRPERLALRALHAEAAIGHGPPRLSAAGREPVARAALGRIGANDINALTLRRAAQASLTGALTMRESAKVSHLSIATDCH